MEIAITLLSSFFPVLGAPPRDSLGGEASFPVPIISGITHTCKECNLLNGKFNLLRRGAVKAGLACTAQTIAHRDAEIQARKLGCADLLSASASPLLSWVVQIWPLSE